MRRSKKILCVSAGLLLLTGISTCGYAQNKIKQTKKKEKQPITIGFQSGRELLFNSTPLLHSRQNKVHYGVSKSLVLRKPLNSHFNLETGIGYAATPSPYNNTILPIKNNIFKQRSYSLPVTVQYFLLSEKYKLRPFCGAGFKYNFFNKTNFSSATTSADLMPQYYTPESDTKYITILFTQGVTFEVNTKIEICQSFHFIPQNNNSTLGFDLGIGFKIQ